MASAPGIFPARYRHGPAFLWPDPARLFPEAGAHLARDFGKSENPRPGECGAFPFYLFLEQIARDRLLFAYRHTVDAFRDCLSLQSQPGASAAGRDAAR